MSVARQLRATWAGAFREAVANRRGFWVQVAVMIVNDIVWVVFWVVFFNAVGEVRGWEVDTLLTLLAVLTTSAGIVLGMVANARHIGVLAADGGLDAALALPVPPLAHVLARRVYPTNLGDVVFGVGLFLVAGRPTPERIVVFVAVVALAALVLAGFLVFAGSLAFFVGRNDAGDLGFHSIIMFAAYPVDIFSGATKVFLYTVVPAGFVGSVPTRLVDSPSSGVFLGLAAAAAVAVALGALTFHAGLRRYASGSVWTRA